VDETNHNISAENAVLFAGSGHFDHLPCFEFEMSVAISRFVHEIVKLIRSHHLGGYA
jgi:hypothetical protein